MQTFKFVEDSTSVEDVALSAIEYAAYYTGVKSSDIITSFWAEDIEIVQKLKHVAVDYKNDEGNLPDPDMLAKQLIKKLNE